MDAREGSEAFYTWIAATEKYPESRWEFRLAREVCDEEQAATLLDFGAGGGDFAKAITAVGRSVCCVELNTVVRKGLERSGLECVGTLDDLDPARQFDVACTFQVIEHLSRPFMTAKEILARVRPGGLFLMSVPNAERMGTGDDDALDFPPHHLSRFSASSLTRFMESLGLEQIAIRAEPPSPEVVSDWLASLITKQPLMRRALRRLILSTSIRNSATTQLHAHGVGGHSLLAWGRTASL